MSKICRTFAPKIGKIMKMYKEPKTEVMSVETGYMMVDSVSPGAPTDPSSPPAPGMPGRRGEIID